MNRENVSSLPEQIAGIIRQRIQRGIYTPGKKIDSIRKLSADLKVSPVTVLRALESLEKTEAVIRLPGRGVFVSEKFKSYFLAGIPPAFTQKRWRNRLYSFTVYGIMTEIF